MHDAGAVGTMRWNVCGKAAPRLIGCTLRAKKCGVRAYGGCAVTLSDCRLEECGEQGVKAFDTASLSLCRHDPTLSERLALLERKKFDAQSCQEDYNQLFLGQYHELASTCQGAPE